MDSAPLSKLARSQLKLGGGWGKRRTPSSRGLTSRLEIGKELRVLRKHFRGPCSFWRDNAVDENAAALLSSFLFHEPDTAGSGQVPRKMRGVGRALYSVSSWDVECSGQQGREIKFENA